MGRDSFLSMFDVGIDDPRLRSLVGRVWHRLPPHDKHVLRELLIDVSDRGGRDSDVLGSASLADPDSFVNGCAAQVAEGLWHVVELANAKDIPSDAACMCVIAHEFAHVVLRHPEMSLVVMNLLGFEPEPIYTDDDLEQLKTWHEEQASLLVWLWGFQDEFKAFADAYPEARRPRWYVEVEVGY